MAVSGLHVPDGGQQAASPERQGEQQSVHTEVSPLQQLQRASPVFQRLAEQSSQARLRRGPPGLFGAAGACTGAQPQQPQTAGTDLSAGGPPAAWAGAAPRPGAVPRLSLHKLALQTAPVEVAAPAGCDPPGGNSSASCFPARAVELQRLLELPRVVEVCVAAFAVAAPLPLPAQKQMVGERFFPVFQRGLRGRALGSFGAAALTGKIAGMLLELDNRKLIVLLESEQQLFARAREAIHVFVDAMPADALVGGWLSAAAVPLLRGP